MTDHPFTKMVSEFYNEVNEKLTLVTRFNNEDLPPRIVDLFKQLSPRTIERYLGSGVIVPENIKGARILDIGCGSGSLVFILSKLVGPTGYVVGIDVSDGLIQTCNNEIEFHRKQWGYEKSNVEFRVLNAERLLELGSEQFDVIVSNGVFCLIPDQVTAFKNVAALLKPGGQFYINDVYTNIDQPEENKKDKNLFSLGTTGAMIWSDLAKVAGKEGFTIPYLTQDYPVDMKDKELHKRLQFAEYACAAYRLFKLPPGAQRGAATVTYLGNIEDYEDAFKWDINLTFQKGVPVNVDAELATILAFTNFKDNFKFEDFSGSVTTIRNQDPFKYMEELKAQGKLGEPIYAVEQH